MPEIFLIFIYYTTKTTITEQTSRSRGKIVRKSGWFKRLQNVEMKYS